MLKHVSFVTARPEDTVAFYARLGGGLAKDVTTPDGLRRLVVGFPGGGRLQFFVGEPPAPPASWMEHIALRADDFDAAVADLRAAGVTFSREPHLSPSGHPVAFVLDPDGRPVEVLGPETA